MKLTISLYVLLHIILSAGACAPAYALRNDIHGKGKQCSLGFPAVTTCPSNFNSSSAQLGAPPTQSGVRGWKRPEESSVVTLSLQDRRHPCKAERGKHSTPRSTTTNSQLDESWTESCEGTVGQQVAGALSWLHFCTPPPEAVWETHLAYNKPTGALLDLASMAACGRNQAVGAGIVLERGTKLACRALDTWELIQSTSKHFTSPPDSKGMTTLDNRVAQHVRTIGIDGEQSRDHLALCLVILYALHIATVLCIMYQQVAMRIGIPRGCSVGLGFARRNPGYLPTRGGGQEPSGYFLIRGGSQKSCWVSFLNRLRRDLVPAVVVPTAGGHVIVNHPPFAIHCSEVLNSGHAIHCSEVLSNGQTVVVTVAHSYDQRSVAQPPYTKGNKGGPAECIPKGNKQPTMYDWNHIHMQNPPNTKGGGGRNHMADNHDSLTRCNPRGHTPDLYIWNHIQMHTKRDLQSRQPCGTHKKINNKKII